MQANLYNPPEPQALAAALDAHDLDITGTVMRLAWLAGLSRNEIVVLTWEQVGFWEEAITLDSRRVPLDPALQDYLLRLSQMSGAEYVVAGRSGGAIAPQVASRLVRAALDEQGLTAVRLIDLRHDYILRQLQTQDWQTVSRISGVAAVTLQQHFAPYLPEKTVVTKADKDKAQGVDPLRMGQILQTQGASPAGLALRLTWQAGLSRSEIVNLRWQDVEGDKIHLNKKTVILEPELVQFFAQLISGEPGELVVRGPVSGGAMLEDRISRLCRAALVQGGIDHVTLQDLRLEYTLRMGGEDQVLAFVRQHGHITRRSVMEMLSISDGAAYHRLKQWVRKGKLTQVGGKYYLPQSVVEPSMQREAVVRYLTENQIAYRKDIAQLLRITPAQCSLLLKRMVTEGQIAQSQQKYSLLG